MVLANSFILLFNIQFFHALNFILHSSYGNTFDTGSEFVVCFDDGSFLMADHRSKNNSTFLFKPKMVRSES